MLLSKSHATLKVPWYSQSPMLLSKAHATLKVPCYYEQIFGGARFARRSLGPWRHLGDILETSGSLCGSWPGPGRPEAGLT